MKTILTTTLLLLVLNTGLSPTQLLAEPTTEPDTALENARQGWLNVLKTRVLLTKVKVSLLQARTEYWIEQNDTAALQSLAKAHALLGEGLSSTDQVTKTRIRLLMLEIDQATKLIQNKGQDVEIKLRVIADRGEYVLNATLVDIQTTNAALKDEVVSRYVLVQTKAAAQKAYIALEIEKSPEKAQQALLDAENYLQQFNSSASNNVLQDKVKVAQQAVREEMDDASSYISALVSSTEQHLQVYGKTLPEKVMDTEEAQLLKRHYAQLEARAALQRANLATKVDATGKQTTAYLDESKAWYNSLKSKTSKIWNKKIADISSNIDEAKQAVISKNKQAHTKVTELLEHAKTMFKNEE